MVFKRLLSFGGGRKPSMATSTTPANMQSGFSLYEVSARAWLYEIRNHYPNLSVKTLADIPDDVLDSIASGNVDMLWLQGVWKLGTVGLEMDRVEHSRVSAYKNALHDFCNEDVIGSPYAIVEYVVSDELGGNSAMRKFRERCAKRGMRLMLDFVPNHMAVDCTWATDPKKKNYFIQKPQNAAHDPHAYLPDGRAHGKDPYCGAWPDTAQLNYFNPELRTAQIANLLDVASLCDGMRVDMAMLLLNKVHGDTWRSELDATGWKSPSDEFWPTAIEQVRRAYPGTIFMAEVYWGLDEELVRHGFDLTYDKMLYDLLESGHMDNLRGYISHKSQQFLRHSVHFVENHDEPRAVAHFGGSMRANAAAAISFLLPGCRLMFHGQWQGFSKRLDVHLRRSAIEPVDSGTERYYAKLMTVLSQAVFHRGDYAFVYAVSPHEGGGDEGWRTVAWRLFIPDQRVFVVVNYTDGHASAHFRLADVEGEGSIELREYMSGQKYIRDRVELRTKGLHVVVRPWGVQVFEY